MRKLVIGALVLLIALISIFVVSEFSQYEQHRMAYLGTLIKNGYFTGDYDTSSREPLFYAIPVPVDVQADMMGKIIYPNSLMTFEDLRYLRISYWGYDDAVHFGEMVVHSLVADEVLQIFEELFDNRFPIERMVLPDLYDGNDEYSMRDNNTSAFNDRPISATARSYHQFGLAIDINPLYNPYYNPATGSLLPSTAREYLHRDLDVKGGIRKGDICYEIFAKYGWTWGGDYRTLKDYQHFEKTTVIDIRSY